MVCVVYMALYGKQGDGRQPVPSLRNAHGEDSSHHAGYKIGEYHPFRALGVPYRKNRGFGCAEPLPQGFRCAMPPRMVFRLQYHPQRRFRCPISPPQVSNSCIATHRGFDVFQKRRNKKPPFFGGFQFLRLGAFLA